VFSRAYSNGERVLLSHDCEQHEQGKQYADCFNHLDSKVSVQHADHLLYLRIRPAKPSRAISFLAHFSASSTLPHSVYAAAFANALANSTLSNFIRSSFSFNHSMNAPIPPGRRVEQ
jgi:hypothetical protein